MIRILASVFFMTCALWVSVSVSSAETSQLTQDVTVGDAGNPVHLKAGTSVQILSIKGSTAVIMIATPAANSGIYQVDASALQPVTAAAPATPAASTPAPAAPPTNPPPTNSPAALSPPSTNPIQLQIEQPDTIQEDLLGKVKRVITTEYITVPDIKGPQEKIEREITTTFDQNGCYLDQLNLGIKNLYTTDIESHYDAAGNLLDRERSRSSGRNFNGTDTQTFDFNTQTATITTTDKWPNSTNFEKTVCSFDRFGKEHESYTYRSTGEQTDHCIMQRNTDGKEISVTFFNANNDPRVEIDIEWNSDGSQSSETISDSDKGTKTVTTYHYTDHDAQGNWTARTESSDLQKDGTSTGTTEMIVKREITYY